MGVTQIRPEPPVYLGRVAIGQSTFLVLSTVSEEDARKKVALEAFMKTEYAFSNLPTELKHYFRPKST